jgi:hypothetical protein
MAGLSALMLRAQRASRLRLGSPTCQFIAIKVAASFPGKPFPSHQETAYNIGFTLTDLEKPFWPTLYGRKSQPWERMSHHAF